MVLSLYEQCAIRLLRNDSIQFIFNYGDIVGVKMAIDDKINDWAGFKKALSFVYAHKDTLCFYDRWYCYRYMDKHGDILKAKLQTLELCKIGVQCHAYNLTYVKEQTEEICIHAIFYHAEAFEYVREQTPKICMAAVEKDGRLLEYVKEQTEEICIVAIENDIRAFKFVEKRTPKIIEAVLEKCMHID